MLLKTILLLCLIIITTALTNEEKAEGPDCASNLYWFPVNSTLNLLCNQVNSLSQLIFVLDSDDNGLPNEVTFKKTSDKPYGCQDTQTYVCAVGYTITQIERVQRPSGQYQWQPKEAQVSMYRCCVKRPLAP